MHGRCARRLVKRKVYVNWLGRARRVHHYTLVVVINPRFKALERRVEVNEEAASCSKIWRLRWGLLDIGRPWRREGFAKLHEARAVASQRALPCGEKVSSYLASQGLQVKVLTLSCAVGRASLQVDPVGLLRARGYGARLIEAGPARISEKVQNGNFLLGRG